MAFDMAKAGTWLNLGLVLWAGSMLPYIGPILGGLDKAGAGFGVPSLGALAVAVGAAMKLAE